MLHAPAASQDIHANKPIRLKIGQVAAQSGLPVKTIRYYEEIDLLAPNVERSDAGYRLFDPNVLNRLAFIKRAQALGLTLNEISSILSVHDDGKLPCGTIRKRLESKLDDIEAQIEALETLRSELEGVLSAWEDKPSADRIEKTICPNIQTIQAMS